MSACRWGHVETVRVLLEAGAGHKLSTCGERAFADACMKGHIEVVHLLVAASVNMEFAVSGKTALMHASEKGHVEIVRFFWKLAGTRISKASVATLFSCVLARNATFRL